MLDSVSIEDIDRLFNELEQLAHSNASRQHFFDAVLDRLQFLLNSPTGLFFQAAKGQWLPAALSGNFSANSFAELLSSAGERDAHICSQDNRHVAVPLRAARWHSGALVVQLAHSPSRLELGEYIKLCQAFAEVLAIRRWSELEVLVDQKLPGFQQALAGVISAPSIKSGACSVVNDLAILIGADRVSLVKANSRGKARALAVSGVAEPQEKAMAVMAISALGQQAIQAGRPLVNYQTASQASALPQSDEHEASTPRESTAEMNTPTSQEASSEIQEEVAGVLLCNHVAVPMQNGNSSDSCNSALVIEWKHYSGFLSGCTMLQHFFPPLVASWQQLERWHRVPRLFRQWTEMPSSMRMGRSISRALRWACWLGGIIAVIWLLGRPHTLRIEADGTLQPVERRAVFAPLDGMISKILVDDGQHVEPGQVLVEMTSPLLEIEIQEVQGEIRAKQEKRNGLDVALNQLAGDAAQIALQSKLSSEIQELETRLETLQEKLAALQTEKQKLVLKAPIGGTVIARQIERSLSSRPVRRGDALLRIADLSGPWRVELMVADRDSGYVKQKLFKIRPQKFGKLASDRRQDIAFVIASQPDMELNAKATWVSEAARNPRGDGMFVDVHADVAQEDVAAGHMGATVHAYFDCGEKPFWFVWSRPLVESIQRKLWF